ncbi:MAG: peptide chain release factor 2 (bRF-2), peptide chain release factor 2 [Berkelbacteria bacterium GW2011_GWE1_39_12]|uniref:Peptide chain release factor 2 n=1 Tax=Berkelbacteria bacterium GW2011_GWE1_39_12 TaxID=1618337 RepID=A0A0G4B4E3_9BACT|nr:MAG: peptide chain release factor 2 (bRF-2), peptide chain release factor 2 [Berkelbacteria bacterium GW2011_GWE1_39_12]
MTTKEELYNLLKIEEKQKKIAEIQKEMNEPSFWGNPAEAGQKTQEMSNLQKLVTEWETAESVDQLKELEIKATLSDKYDENGAILTLHSGAGGTEAQDWAEMLLRMYERYAERKDFKYELLEISSGEEAGVKSATLKITGPYAFGYLKTEAGVHRLVRMSPFDADKARHTSFALVEVIPDIPEAETLPIEDKELKIDVYRSGGHGGQSVNTTDSAVRVTHLPSGIVVAVQNERSQGQNKALAMHILQSKLLALKLRKQKEEEAKLRGEHMSAAFGSQIRSYVLQPYQQVKDHRTEVTSTNPDDVLNGNIDLFIEGMLKKNNN